MFQIERALKNPRLMRSLTGLNKAEFDVLLVNFEKALQVSCPNKARQRAIGGGRKGYLRDIASKLFFILLYVKVYPTYDVAGFMFNADRSRVCRWVGQLLNIRHVA